jgi:uncharacterized damage-inducible protein DinB
VGGPMALVRLAPGRTRHPNRRTPERPIHLGYPPAMTTVGFMLLSAESAYRHFREQLEDLDQRRAWARVTGPWPEDSDEHLNTDGSIQGIVLHCATAKKLYASAAFRGLELRWRDLAEELDRFEPDWPAALAYLDEAHTYWIESWADMTDADLERPCLHFTGEKWPSWRIVQVMTWHDAYHAGQLAVVRFATDGSDVPPPSQAEDIRTHCRSLPTW